MCIIVNIYRLWDKSGWLKITDRRCQFRNILRFQVPLHGVFNLLICVLVVDWRAVDRVESSQVLNRL